MKQVLSLSTVLAFTALNLFAQGQLQPPSGPAPSMVSLDQIAKRIDAIPIGTIVPNYPATLSVPGYYYLTNNWSFTGTWGIIITTNNVVLDLNGFTVSGNGEGGGAISATVGTTNITVRNGTISGTKGSAIVLNGTIGAAVENIAANNNGGGILMFTDALVKNCIVLGSGYHGIAVSHRSTIQDCKVYNSKNTGISLADSCVVQNSTSISNGSYGIFGQNGNVIRNCLSAHNKSTGIRLFLMPTIENCQSLGNAIDGFYTGDGGTVTACVAAGNTNFGFFLGKGVAASQCTSRQNQSYGFYTLAEVALADCHAQTNKSIGFMLYPSARVLDCTAVGNSGGFSLNDLSEIRGSTAIGNEAYGIQVFGTNVVVNNTIMANGRTNVAHGILVQGNRNIIEGNHTVNNTGYGIRVSGIYNVLIKNVATGNTSGASYVAGGNDSAPWTTAASQIHPAGNISGP